VPFHLQITENDIISSINTARIYVRRMAGRGDTSENFAVLLAVGVTTLFCKWTLPASRVETFAFALSPRIFERWLCTNGEPWTAHGLAQPKFSNG
jgi:hypothetical protein